MLLCSIVSETLPSGEGHYTLSMVPFEDNNFTIPLTKQRNIKMEMGPRSYVEVQTEGLDERHVAAILDSCWAAPFDNASYPVRWNLIIRA